MGHLMILVLHPQYTTDQQLAEWLARLEVRSDPRYDVLRWSTPGSSVSTHLPELIISFKTNGVVDVSVEGRFTRSIAFLDARNDDERMQQLLDILVNCWARQGMIALDLADVYSVLEASERGVIAAVNDVQMLPDYCARWPQEVAPRLGSGRLTSLQCISREYEPSLASLSRYADEVERMGDEDLCTVIGVMRVDNPSDLQGAVLYYGMSES